MQIIFAIRGVNRSKFDFSAIIAPHKVALDQGFRRAARTLT